MADYLSRACRLQLTTAMENLIRTAVYEISQIFEDSLHDHQVELARKGEEIAYLKIKLQRAELRLKEVSIGSEPELTLNQSFESPKASEEPAPPPAANQSSFAPAEFEFEVTDDWCVPLESENVNKPENPCPSVRLKQFSIPLCPIPLKHEAFSRLDISILRRRRSKDSSRTESQETKPKRRRGRPAVVQHQQVKEEFTPHQKGQNLTGIVEEVNSYEDNESKQEPNTLQSNLQLAINQQVSLSTAQPKTEILHWDESNLTAAQLHDEDALSPPLSLSPKVCSDTGRKQVWLRGINTAQESAIENLPSNEPIWSGPLRRCRVYGRTDETLSDGSFLSQELENSASSSGTKQVVQRGESGPKNHLRHGTTFRSRDRPQANFHPFARRNIDCHRPADSSRPYSCPYCAKCFAYPSHQRRHLLRHTGVRLHLCQFCDKRFLTTSELTVHTRTHTGERPFGCGQCGKRFARSGNLRAHQRDVHLGKRPFSCTECGKKFSHKGNLRVHHHRVHQGQQ